MGHRVSYSAWGPNSCTVSVARPQFEHRMFTNMEAALSELYSSPDSAGLVGVLKTCIPQFHLAHLARLAYCKHVTYAAHKRS